FPLSLHSALPICWSLFARVVIFLVLNILLPIGFGIFATTAQHDTVGEPPQGFEALTLPTIDGDTLAVWYAPPQNGTVIIAVHGANGSRESVRRYLPMFTDAGYGVLTFDQRGHGESTGEVNLFGWNGTEDLGTALEFLHTQD